MVVNIKLPGVRATELDTALEGAMPLTLAKRLRVDSVQALSAEFRQFARDNIGLGNSSVLDVGTTVGTVAAGDDSRLGMAATALQPATGVFRVATFFGAPTENIPAAVQRVFVEDRSAHFARVGSEPSHALKFQNGSQWWSIDEDQITVTMGGATGDGVADDRQAFLDVATTGREIIVPRPTVRYRLTGSVALSNYQGFLGQDFPEVQIDNASSALLFDFSGRSKAVVSGLRITASVTTAQTAVIKLHNAYQCEFIGNIGAGLPSDPLTGTVEVTGSSFFNSVSHNFLENCAGTAIKLQGNTVGLNDIVGNTLQGNGAFGIFLDSQTNRNRIVGNKTTSSTLELIGVRYTSYGNLIQENHAEGSGDNGISISGYQNTVIGNLCRRNDQDGIGIFGSGNIVSGNTSYDNGQDTVTAEFSGIGIWPGFGGVAQYNLIANNQTGNTPGNTTQKHGVRLNGNLFYPSWASGVAITAGAQRLNGLNVYQAATSGTTGVTAPVHTSGTVSDGGVSWTYIASFVSVARASFNEIGPNVSRDETNAFTADVSLDTNHLLTRDDFRMPGKAVIGGGVQATWTGVNTCTVGNGVGNTGVAIWPGTGGLGRVAFGVSSARAWLEYAQSTDTLTLQHNAVTMVALATAGLGFHGATPTGKQTISAALATDGSATSAQMSTAINSIRTALINKGLCQ